MTDRETTFDGVRFTADTIKAAVAAFEEIQDAHEIRFEYMNVKVGRDSWRFDTLGQFYAAIRQPCDTFSIRLERTTKSPRKTYSAWVHVYNEYSTVSISAPDRDEVDPLLIPFLENEDACRLPEPEPIEMEVFESPKPVVFIGHGRNSAWRDLKDHLVDSHGYEVVAYETGSRSGHTIRDVLDSMLGQATFAIVVMTGEDVQADDNLRARQNVVHEAGLFQGRLGFQRVAVLRERGVENFSNIDGIQYISFNKGAVRETFGDVLAHLRREFDPVRR